MPATAPLGPRQRAFAEFVRSALRRAAPATIPEIAERADVGKSTIYRWRDGDWSGDRDPSPAQVKRFCEAAGVPVMEAFQVLWLAEDGERRVEPAAADDPDVLEILKALRSGSLTQAERFHLRETLRGLADRYRQGSSRPRRTG